MVTIAGLQPDGSDRSVLCAVHAAAMSVPRGWTLDDARVTAPPLFRVPSAAAGSLAERRPSSRRHPAAGTAGRAARADPSRPAEQLRLVVSEPDTVAAAVAEQQPEPAADPDPGPDATTVLAWTPKFDDADDLDGLLHARSPLLSRAFRHPPRNSG